MSPTVISVERLSKEYIIGSQENGADTFREMLVSAITAPFRRLKQLSGKVVPEERIWALKNVNFAVKEGEVLGIIGRNGAGKSTLLKILSRITAPTKGRVELCGRVTSLLEVGTGFHPELTGRENIYLNGAILGMSRAEITRKFDAIVAFAEVEKFLDTPVKRYSSGMYVRLAFAVAAHLEPEILVVDEVLAVGDVQFQRKCLGKMGEIAKEGRTVVFVSHNMAAVRSLCQRGIILHSGRMAFAGPVEEAVRKYLLNENKAKLTAWMRPCGSKDIGFEKLSVSFSAEPSLKLSCFIRIRIRTDHSKSMLAVDIVDALGASIMQACPQPLPFVPGAPGCYELTLDIFLPPLIPGTYWLSFWMGPHNTQTYDIVDNALAFDVFNSPTHGRTFPHTIDHGYIVPPSSCSLDRIFKVPS